MADWVDNEEGPDCGCGNPTVVKIAPGNKPILLCLFHTGREGLYRPLPQEKPDDWMADTNRLRVLVDAENKSDKSDNGSDGT